MLEIRRLRGVSVTDRRKLADTVMKYVSIVMGVFSIVDLYMWWTRGRPFLPQFMGPMVLFDVFAYGVLVGILLFGAILLGAILFKGWKARKKAAETEDAVKTALWTLDPLDREMVER
jgi:hypothetical protein